MEETYTKQESKFLQKQKNLATKSPVTGTKDSHFI